MPAISIAGAPESPQSLSELSSPDSPLLSCFLFPPPPPRCEHLSSDLSSNAPAFTELPAAFMPPLPPLPLPMAVSKQSTASAPIVSQPVLLSSQRLFNRLSVGSSGSAQSSTSSNSHFYAEDTIQRTSEKKLKSAWRSSWQAIDEEDDDCVPFSRIKSSATPTKDDDSHAFQLNTVLQSLNTVDVTIKKPQILAPSNKEELRRSMSPTSKVSNWNKLFAGVAQAQSSRSVASSTESAISTGASSSVSWSAESRHTTPPTSNASSPHEQTMNKSGFMSGVAGSPAFPFPQSSQREEQSKGLMSRIIKPSNKVTVGKPVTIIISKRSISDAGMMGPMDPDMQSIMSGYSEQTSYSTTSRSSLKLVGKTLLDSFIPRPSLSEVADLSWSARKAKEKTKMKTSAENQSYDKERNAELASLGLPLRRAPPSTKSKARPSISSVRESKENRGGQDSRQVEEERRILKELGRKF